MSYGSAATLSIVLRVPLALFFVWLSYRNLSGDGQMAADFQRWEYSERFRLAVGVAQALGGAALLLPQTCFAGALLLCGILAGAIYTHARFDPLFTALTPVAFLLPVAALALLHRPQGWF